MGDYGVLEKIYKPMIPFGIIDLYGTSVDNGLIEIQVLLAVAHIFCSYI